MEIVNQVLPYALVVLVLVLLFLSERKEFEKIVLMAIAEVERELSTAEGSERMASAIEKVISVLPVVMKTALTFVASLMGTDLHGLTHKLVQAIYDLMKAKFKPSE